MSDNPIVIKILGAEEDCAQIKEVVCAMLEYMSLAGEIETAQTVGAANIGYTSTFPAIVIAEKTVCRGRIPQAAEVSTWLADAAIRG